MANLRLLRYLFGLRDRYLLPQAISSDTGLPPDRIHGEMEILLREGYRITYHPSYGYRFEPGPEILDPIALERDLEGRTVGREIHSLREVASTMDVAWEIRAGGGPSGAVVIAASQRRGRGRFGRSWSSPRGGGLYLSVLLTGEDVPRPYSLITVSSAIAVAEAVEIESGIPARIRWPNDIVAGGRKLGGILIEMRQEGSGLPAVVVGVGLNVSLDPADLPVEVRDAATSLAREGARRADIGALARGTIRSLDRWVGRTLDGGAGAVAGRWRDLSSILGRRVSLRRGDLRHRGVVSDVDPVRGLSLDLGGGEVRTFPAEQVSLVPEE